MYYLFIIILFKINISNSKKGLLLVFNINNLTVCSNTTSIIKTQSNIKFDDDEEI